MIFYFIFGNAYIVLLITKQINKVLQKKVGIYYGIKIIVFIYYLLWYSNIMENCQLKIPPMSIVLMYVEKIVAKENIRIYL